MTAETKIYSDFIKRNKVVVSQDSFVVRLGRDNYKQVKLQKDDDGKWYADNEDRCYTKKAAIYWYLKNNTDLK